MWLNTVDVLTDPSGRGMVIGKHAVSGDKTRANEKQTMCVHELWPMEDKEMRLGRNHSQWKEALRVCHVGV